MSDYRVLFPALFPVFSFNISFHLASTVQKLNSAISRMNNYYPMDCFVHRLNNLGLGPVVQKPTNASPRLKIYQGVYVSSPKCGSTLIYGKTFH